LWYGDILYTYALCGMLVYLFRRRSPKTLIILGIIMVAVSSALSFGFHASMPHWPPEGIEDMAAAWKPGAEKMAEEIEAYRGGWLDQMPHRATTALMFETFLFLAEHLGI
ncbi:hypothetical protein IH799_03635, partial [candidate division KSB1 bacterium]|nr:hypothetical protein [candidate division KSB1 bacterium]